MIDLNEDIKHSAKVFIEQFKSVGSFDYSLASLYTIDEMLNDLHDSKINDDEMMNAISLFGSYIFETIQKNYSGTYCWDEEKQLPFLAISNLRLYVFEKVALRINKGNKHNIIDYLKEFLTQLANSNKNKINIVH